VFSDNGSDIDWNKALPLNFLFSHGVAKRFSTNWRTSITSDGAGLLNVQAAIITKSPLEDQLVAIKSKLDDIWKFVKPEGAISQKLQQIQTRLEGLAAEVLSCNSKIGDENDIVAVKKDLDAIKKAIGI
jgi:hypothetical protein